VEGSRKMYRKVEFYERKGGSCPVGEFLDSLNDKVAKKILWVLDLLEDLHPIPKQYYKKLENNIWECRVKLGSNIYRIFGFFDGKDIILTHGIVKKTDKVPRREIIRAEKVRTDYYAGDKR
jgi:phage-related protein